MAVLLLLENLHSLPTGINLKDSLAEMKNSLIYMSYYNCKRISMYLASQKLEVFSVLGLSINAQK